MTGWGRTGSRRGKSVNRTAFGDVWFAFWPARVMLLLAWRRPLLALGFGFRGGARGG